MKTKIQVSKTFGDPARYSEYLDYIAVLDALAEAEATVKELVDYAMANGGGENATVAVSFQTGVVTVAWETDDVD